MIGGGLLAGAFFFISHTAIFGIGLSVFTTNSIDFWWRAGWPALILNPLAWYIAVLWYAGYWDDPYSSVRTRQRPWMYITIGIGAILLALLLFTPFLPSFEQLAVLDLSNPFNLSGISLLLLAYPIFILLCTGLSLDVLLRPGPSTRVLATVARKRARPWLIAASIDFLLVTIFVSGMLLWVVSNLQNPVFIAQIDQSIAIFDFMISGLISFAILAIGQAFVAYEIFTGSALPRQGLARGWRRVIILSAGYGTLIGGAFALRWHPIYSLLLTALLMVTFFALLNWRSFAERDLQMRLLRPFVSAEGMYERLLAENLPDKSSFTLIDELIQTVLDASWADLIPVGARATLVEAYAFPVWGDIPSRR
ncbi:MAG: hypothetical protein HC806_01120 [Anaerolineae bacterium]|nr:hypothetical protein [Anaerolineae bacterium]